MEISASQTKLRINLEESITIQLLLQITLLNQDHISQNDLKILVHLAMQESEVKGSVLLRKFCDQMGPVISNSEAKVVKGQYVRNRVNELTKKGFIQKSDEDGLRKISLSKKLDYINKVNHRIQLDFLVL